MPDERLDAILLGGGPSLEMVTQELLDRVPCITMAINHHAHAHGLFTDQFVTVDGPQKTHSEGPEIGKHISDVLHEPGTIKWYRNRFLEDEILRDAPAVRGFPTGYNLKPKDYFTSEHIYCGESRFDDEYDGPGWRFFHMSSFFPPFRLLYDQGVRRIWMFGVDFDEPLSLRFCLISEQFNRLRPVFEEAGLEVYNCNPDSYLPAFPHAPFPASYEVYRHDRRVEPHELTKCAWRNPDPDFEPGPERTGREDAGDPYSATIAALI
jgi:hypothetical protein